MFETHWSSGNEFCVHVYSGRSNVTRVALALDAKSVQEIKDTGIYDSSSGSRIVHEGEFLVMQNANGYHASVKIIDVKYRRPNGPDKCDQLIFDYWILADKTTDFSVVAG